jgi:archaellum component FlaC
MDNNQAEINIDDNTNVESLVSLIKEQTKELKLTKKKLEKLEEKFVKTNTDLKNILKDKNNIENFFRTIFPKDMQDGLIKSEYGLYDTSELNKLWLICESKNQSEFHKILNQLKKENSDLSEKVKLLTKEMELKTNEVISFKNQAEQLNSYADTFNDLNKKIENLEIAKRYLLDIISQKDEEISNFNSLELEMAELKAKALLEDLDTKVVYEKKESTNTIQPQAAEKIKISIYIFTEGSLNTASQTTEQIYGTEYVNNLEKQVSDLKNKYEKLRKEFNVSFF